MGIGKPLDERVASLEVTVSSIADSVRSLAGSVTEGFAQGRRDRETSNEVAIRGLREVQAKIDQEREARRPQYQTQAAWAGVVLTIVFGAWALTSKGYDRDVARIEMSIAELQGTRLQSGYERGVLEGKLTGVERLLAQIDTSLQSEIDVHVKRMDDKLQIEMRGQRDVQQKDIDWMKARMDRLTALIDFNTTNEQANNSTLGRLTEEQRWTEKGLAWAMDRAQENRSSIDQATARQSERLSVFEDLKRRVLALEDRTLGKP